MLEKLLALNWMKLIASRSQFLKDIINPLMEEGIIIETEIRSRQGH